jgi:hypothetical protein
MASMLRADLADARGAWLEEAASDHRQHEERTRSDFLLDVNHAGQHLDFHSLRHTCGAWLAQAGVHPKTVQVIMRHSAITLTMDTYGHLFPGQEADAINALPRVFAASSPSESDGPETASNPISKRQQYRQQRESNQSPPGPSERDAVTDDEVYTLVRKFLQMANLCDEKLPGATEDGNALCRTRTYDPLIKRV